MSLIQTASRFYFSFYMKEIEHFIGQPAKTQEQVFGYLLKNGSKTLYGQEHNFNQIKSRDDFRKRVPLITYDELKPYIEKIIVSKAKNVLWNKPVKWFAMSSGTTNDRSKYIPVTSESLNDSHYKCGKQMLGLYLNAYPDSRFLLGKTMVLGGSQQVNNIGDGIFTGDVSAILMSHLPFWANSRRTPQSIALIPDWEQKLDKLVDYALKTDVRAMTGVPSWMMVLLQKMVEKTGKPIKEIWTNIDVFFHGGISFTPYQEQYHEIFKGTDIHYWETYNASEGFFGLQYDKASKELLLMLDNNIYYEFLPLDQLDKENPQTLLLEEISTNIDYALIISTNGGLWRYMIGDTVRFSSTSPHLFRITGRTKHYINAFGEELMVDNADNALKIAAEKTKSRISDYTAAPVFFENMRGAHEWLIEFEEPPADINAFSDILDEELKKLNSDYAAKRSYDLSLKKPIVRAVPKGTFLQWLKSRNKLGGQNKIPRLSNTRDYIEGIHSIL